MSFPGGPCTVLDWVSKKFNVITRSSFCAELRNQLEAAQTSLYLSQSLEENCRKIESANVLSQLLDQGKLPTPIHLCGDNMGSFHSSKCTEPKDTGRTKFDFARPSPQGTLGQNRLHHFNRMG